MWALAAGLLPDDGFGGRGGQGLVGGPGDEDLTYSMLESHPAELGGLDPEAIAACIDECLSCIQACVACADAVSLNPIPETSLRVSS
jgi:hypothetical protein